jgi:hypothetical protein
MNNELFKEISRYDVDGMCSYCKEYTNVLEPCCNASIYVEGGFINAEDFTQEEIDAYFEWRSRK